MQNCNAAGAHKHIRHTHTRTHTRTHLHTHTHTHAPSLLPTRRVRGNDTTKLVRGKRGFAQRVGFLFVGSGLRLRYSNTSSTRASPAEATRHLTMHDERAMHNTWVKATELLRHQLHKSFSCRGDTRPAMILFWSRWYHAEVSHPRLCSTGS